MTRQRKVVSSNLVCIFRAEEDYDASRRDEKWDRSEQVKLVTASVCPAFRCRLMPATTYNNDAPY